MSIYVDGFNAIHTLGFKGEKKAQIEQLIVLISQHFANQITHIFLDGYQLHVLNSNSQIRLHFSLDKTADEHILAFLKKKRSSSVSLFTNDRELGTKAKTIHQSVQVFSINQLNQKPNELSKKNKSEVKMAREKNLLAPDSQWFTDLYLIKNKIQKR